MPVTNHCMKLFERKAMGSFLKRAPEFPAAHRGRRELARALLSGLLLAAVLGAPEALAQKKYDQGATDKTIKIGNTMPYSGPATGFSIIGKAIKSYFNMVNAEGGVNGRKIEFISYDDGFSPPKTVEQVRKLVESDEVLLVFNLLGTAGNTAVRKYLNTKLVPHLFIASGASKWGDPGNFPWSMGFQPDYRTEVQIYAKYILETYPKAKIGIVYQNDDYGKDYLLGLKDALGDRAKTMLVSQQSYEVTDPTIDTQILEMRAAGADVVVDVTSPKFASLAIRKMAEIGWKPVHVMNYSGSSIGGALKPAGLENAVGLISASYAMDPTDPTWSNDPAMKKWAAFMDKWMAGSDKTNNLTVYAYSAAWTMVEVLRRCGDDLTRANIMRQTTSLKDLEVPLLLPGIRVNTSPKDYYPIEQMQLMRFTGERWEQFGPVMGSAR
jgi:branched-chain amino acid transport system substrate-binding protein